MSASVSLTQAVTAGDESAVSAFLANGADVNESTNGGQTPLILAVIFGHTHVVRLLLKAGADPQLRDNLGLNAVEWAQRRGLNEALTLLTNGPISSSPPRRILIPLEEPQQPKRKEVRAADDNGAKETVSDDEKSRRWLSGLKKRLDEQASRRKNTPPEPSPAEEDQSPIMSVTTRQPPAEEPAQTSEPEPVTPKISVAAAPRILTPPPAAPAQSGKRKRCPRCNAVYNGELVSYCAHHIVPLVDADEPIVSETPKSSVPLFWILLVITLTGSIVAGSLIATYLYKSNQQAERSAAAQQQAILQKGTPELGGELVGKAVSLPEAECPVKGPEPVTGTVTVSVMVDKNGQVYWARGAGGDWLMRGASTEAAMKSTFSPEKLRGRETEGTITYTFKP